MIKIRVLFYKARVDGKWLDDAISIYTGLLPCNWGTKGYSHVEIWLPSEINGFYRAGGTYYGQCLSSTSRGDFSGVRIAPASEVLKHPERWDYMEFEIDEERLEVVLEESKKLIGLPYDFWGIFGFLQPFNTQDSKEWYCSEISAWFLYLVRVLDKRETRISPRRLSKVLIKKYKRKPKVLK